MVQQPLDSQGLFIIKVSRTRSDTPHSVGTTLDKWSARRMDLYLTAQNTHKRQTSMAPAGFKPTIPASKWPQTQALDSAASGIGGNTI